MMIPKELLLPQKTNTLSHLWPFGVQESCFDGIIQGLVILLDFHVGCRSITVEDAVLRINSQSLVVQHDSGMKITIVASLVALADFLNKFSFAQHGTVRTTSSKGFWSKERYLGREGEGNDMLLLGNATQKRGEKNQNIRNCTAKIKAPSSSAEQIMNSHELRFLKKHLLSVWVVQKQQKRALWNTSAPVKDVF